MCSWFTFCLMVCGYQLMKICTTFWILGTLWLPVAWVSSRSSCASLSLLNHFKVCIKKKELHFHIFVQLCSQIWNKPCICLCCYMSTQKNTTCEWRCYGWTNSASTFFWVIPCGYDMTKRTSYSWFMCQTILENFIVQPCNIEGMW